MSYAYAKDRIKSTSRYCKSTPMTVNQMREQVDKYMNEHKGQKTIITLDHSILVKESTISK